MNTAEKIYGHSPAWMQNIFTSAYGYYWKKRRFGGIFREEYKKAKDRESFSASQWNEYREKQLQRILLHAFDYVPLYSKRFSEQGLSREKLAKITATQLSGLPVLSKDDLRRHGKKGLVSGKKEKGGQFYASSGSTGTPAQILFSDTMHQRWTALMESRVRNWAGVSSSIPRGMLGGRRVLPKAHNSAPFFRYNAFEKQVYFSAYHISAKNAANYLQGMKEYKVVYMTGYAMSNFFLARFLQEQNLKAQTLKAVITSSESLTAEMRNVFHEVYGCKTYDSWSGLEACGLISECEQGSLHISPDAGYIEVLDENLQPVAAGVAGAVYCTGFLNYDQPLIRYNIGDSIMLSKRKCGCEREMPVVEEIIGRTEDTVIGKDGREMVRFHSVFYHLDVIKKAQVIQENTEEIAIKIVSERKLEKFEEMILRNRIESQLGDIKVIIDYVDEIPLNNNGKFQAVISKVKREGK